MRRELSYAVSNVMAINWAAAVEIWTGAGVGRADDHYEVMREFYDDPAGVAAAAIAE